MRHASFRGGMSTLQALLLLGGAFVVVWGLMSIWKAVQDPLQKQADMTLAGQAGASASGEADTPGDLGRKPAPTTPGVTVRPDGRVVSQPDTGPGADDVVSADEQRRNMQAIARAVNASPFGIAVIGGDHRDGGPSAIDRHPEGFDHVAVAYRDGNQIRILEMLPSDSSGFVPRNFGKPGSGPRGLGDFAAGYDLVHGVPLGGVTAQQAGRFIRELAAITARGQDYGFVRGQVCSTAIALALERAGIPTSLDRTTGGVNDLLPRSVVEEFERLRAAGRVRR